MKVHAAVYNIDMTEKFARDITADVAEDSATRVLTLPDISGLSATYFVSLSLSDNSDSAPGSSQFCIGSRQPLRHSIGISPPGITRSTKAFRRL